MSETVTSKYEIVFWVKLIGFPLFGLIAIVCFVITSFNNDDPNRIRNLIIATVIIIAVVCRYAYRYMKTPLEKIIVSPENIIIHQYVTNKKVLINYPDINKTSTVREPSRGSEIFSQINNYQILRIELNNGDIYDINEGDFENYSELKQAIYHHLFKYQ